MCRAGPILTVLLVLAACSDSGDVAVATSAIPTSETTIASDDGSASGDTNAQTADDSTTTEEPTTTEASEEEPVTSSTAETTEDDVEQLCTAYLDSINPTTFDQGLAGLAAVLGSDAPSGVLGAIDTLQNPADDVEAFFAARNSIDNYVLPVCEQRFRSSITPRADDAAAADAFIAAVRNGDRNAGEGLAPTNVVVQFDWAGYPESTADFNSDNSTLTMVLEPTVSVFCQLSGGAVEFCAFSE